MPTRAGSLPLKRPLQSPLFSGATGDLRRVTARYLARHRTDGFERARARAVGCSPGGPERRGGLQRATDTTGIAEYSGNPADTASATDSTSAAEQPAEGGRHLEARPAARTQTTARHRRGALVAPGNGRTAPATRGAAGRAWRRLPAPPRRPRSGAGVPWGALEPRAVRDPTGYPPCGAGCVLEALRGLPSEHGLAFLFADGLAEDAGDRDELFRRASEIAQCHGGLPAYPLDPDTGAQREKPLLAFACSNSGRGRSEVLVPPPPWAPRSPENPAYPTPPTRPGPHPDPTSHLSPDPSPGPPRSCAPIGVPSATDVLLSHAKVCGPALIRPSCGMACAHALRARGACAQVIASPRFERGQKGERGRRAGPVQVKAGCRPTSLCPRCPR